MHCRNVQTQESGITRKRTLQRNTSQVQQQEANLCESMVDHIRTLVTICAFAVLNPSYNTSLYPAQCNKSCASFPEYYH